MLESLTTTQYRILSSLGKLLVLGFILLSNSSCTDQGCIEADDFGEYEQQTLTIPANALSESCDYYPDKPLTDPLQGTGIKQCATQGNPQVTDENGNVYTVTTNNGCMGFEVLNIQRICVEDCREKCINGASGSSGNAEPFWTATSKKKPGQNIGVNLTPGAEIYIRAVGNVVLGGDISEPIHTQSTNYGLQSLSNVFSQSFFDIKQSVAKTINFSGKWTNGSTTYGGDISSSSAAEQIRTLNGARRIVAFLIPHPEEYNFDTHNATTEINGTKGTPLFADDRLWQCSYVGTDMEQSTCNSYSYNGNGFPNTNDAIATFLYGITSAAESSTLGIIGGAIRWTDDLLGKNLSEGTFIGDLSNNIEKPGSADYAVRVTLKDTSSTNSCNAINLQYHVVSSRSIDGGSTGNRVTVIPDTIITDLNNFHVDLEPEDSIIFTQNTALDDLNANCGTKIAFKTHRLQDIKIEKSGFVGFTTLTPSGSSNGCSLSGRIINKGGKRINDSCDINDPSSLGCFDNDFYEYDPFGTANSIDPIDNLSIPISSSPSATSYTKNWSNKFFVRKGQTIRLAPENWENNWSSGAISRKCGVGMLMKVGGLDYGSGKIDDRPALLCRGSATEEVPNPSCIPSGTTPETCRAYSEKCIKLDQNGNPEFPTHFCPNPACQVSSPDSNLCDNSDETPPNNSPAVTVSQCKACFNAMQAAASEPVKMSLNIDQCYDLENYNGKVSNIPSSTGFTEDQLTNSEIAKGAEKISSFNGSYGNFSNFADTGKIDKGTNNRIYRLKEPLYANYNGRLTFLLIDNDSFDQTMITNYSDNGSSGTSYSGTNGYKIDLSGRQEFKNGEWLEAILCAETSDTSTLCSSTTIPTQLESEPHIIVVNDPTFAGQSPSSKTYYQFDPYGNITAFTNSNAIGVTPSGLSQVSPGSNFYRHGYTGADQTNDAESDEAKNRVSNLRISFKIKDTDIVNCDLDNPLLGQSTCTATRCGIVSENRFYDATVSSNTNSICQAGESPSDDDCKKQFFCANPYYNNSGSYDVIVRVKNKQSDLSNIVNSVVSPVIEIMDGTPDRTKIGQTEKMYIQIVNDARFQAIVQIMVILMITFYGVGYLMGVSEFSQTEIVIRIIKIGVIFLFIGPNGWEWFNRFFVQLFKNGTDYVTFLMASAFDKSAELQNAIDNNSFYDKSILFGSIDKVFGLFFNSVVQKKISALLFASVFGPIYLLMIYWGFMSYVFAVAYAVLLYLTAQIFISILFVVGPIFFIMLLFNQTKEMFDKWLGELIGLSLQQIFLLTTLAFFSMMMYEIVKLSLGYRICWDNVWTIPIGPIRIKLLSFWTIASMPPKLNLQSDVANVGSPEGIPSLFTVLFIWVIGSLARKFIEFMTAVASAIGGSAQAISLSSGLKDMANQGYAAAKGIVNSKIGNTFSGAAQQADRFLFDSGKKADDDRKKSREELQKDRKNRSSLMKTGNEAVEKFKRDNGKDLIGKSQAEKEATLKEVRRKAMNEKGATLGLSEDNIKKLLEERAQFKGDDIASALYNVHQDRKIWDASAADKRVDTRVTGSQIINTSKNLSDAERVNLKKDLKDGKLQTNISNFEQMKTAASAGDYGSAAMYGAAASVSALGSPFKNIGSYALNRLRSVKTAGANALRVSDYAKARSELQKEGVIDKNFIQTDDQKRMIVDRLRQIQTDREGNKTNVSSSSSKFIDRAIPDPKTPKTPKPEESGSEGNNNDDNNNANV